MIAAAAILGGCVTAAPGASAHNRLIAGMMDDIGDRRPKGCPSRWCACYLERELRAAGFEPLGSYRARDYARWGRPAKAGAIGSVMVMRSHVGVVIGRCKDGKVRVVSGNHSNRVDVGCYPAGSAIAWRQ